PLSHIPHEPGVSRLRIHPRLTLLRHGLGELVTHPHPRFGLDPPVGALGLRVSGGALDDGFDAPVDQVGESAHLGRDLSRRVHAACSLPAWICTLLRPGVVSHHSSGSRPRSRKAPTRHPNDGVTGTHRATTDRARSNNSAGSGSTPVPSG